MILSLCDISPACLFNACPECTDPQCADHCHDRDPGPRPVDHRTRTDLGWRNAPTRENQ